MTLNIIILCMTALLSIPPIIGIIRTTRRIRRLKFAIREMDALSIAVTRNEITPTEGLERLRAIDLELDS